MKAVAALSLQRGGEGASVGPRHRQGASRHDRGRFDQLGARKCVQEAKYCLLAAHLRSKHLPPAPEHLASSQVRAGVEAQLDVVNIMGGLAASKHGDRAYAEPPAPKWDVTRCRRSWNPLTSRSSRTL